jgi:UDP-N-acetylmuramate dehydrogenase
MLEIKEYVDIKDYSTLKIGGQFRYFVKISSVEELNSFYAIAQNKLEYKDIPIFILGGGSNIVFSNGVINVIALKIEIKGFEIKPIVLINNENSDYVYLKIGAGEIWDEIVSKTVDMNLCGLESLSAIPGTVGATPVQNVGAYGSEVKDTIVEVAVFDKKEKIIKTLSNADCKFGYRDSIFKNEAKGKYIITSVVYRLYRISPLLSEEGVGGGDSKINHHLALKGTPPQKGGERNVSEALSYPGVKKYFEENGIENPSLAQIREAIINIRKDKLPNPKEIPNVGSFFKNPIVTREVFETCTSRTGTSDAEMPHFDIGDNMVKIPAGWLIENAGLKGHSFGNISVYDKNALVLINNGNATKEDLLKARAEIIKIVEDKFRITLEQEPEII